MLKICIQYSVKVISSESTQSVAIPLRVLEIFTNFDDVKNSISEDKVNQQLANILSYLVQNEYFEQLKKMLIIKVPGITEPSANPPSPIAKWIFDMIQRPLLLVNKVKNDEYSSTVMRELCRSILTPKMIEPIQGFIIPALCTYKDFPFNQLMDCINRLKISPSISLFYSVLVLEPSSFGKRHVPHYPCCNCQTNAQSISEMTETKHGAIHYLQVLASLSTTINSVQESPDLTCQNNPDSDSDTDMLEENDEAITLRRCIEMLNEEHRVHRILASVDRSNDASLMQALCHLCHNLLVNNKSAIHKYKLLYTLAFKTAFLKELWYRVSTVSQTSLFGESTPLLQIMSRGIALSQEETSKIVPLLAVFCSLFSMLITTLHDNEFFSESTSEMYETNGQQQQAMPFTISTLIPLSSHLKGVCLGLVELAFPDTRPSVRDDYKSAVLGATSSMQTPHNKQMWTHLFR